ncbi:MAG: ribonuclease [Pseudonocardiales bacterium]|nr:ribonuclease [Pseudonocardiales bacterium]
MLDSDSNNQSSNSQSDNSPSDNTTPATDGPAPLRRRSPRKVAEKATAPSAADTSQTDAPADAPAPRKRAPRKATAPAGTPPVSPAPSASAEGDAVPAKKAAKKAAKTSPAEAPAAKKAPAKRAAAKKAAKKAAADGPVDPAADALASPSAPTFTSPEAAAAAPAPAKKAARKRTAKKTAEAAVELAEPVEPVEPVEAAGPGAPAMAAPGIVFVAPTEDAAPRRRRPAKQAAPALADATDEPEPAEVDLTAAEDAEDQTAEPEDVREAAIEQATGARRRRRRGRRGRGGAARADDDADAEDGDIDEPQAAAEAEDSAEPAGSADDAGEGGTHRRRRRRRSGSGGGDDDGSDKPNTVTHVREPKSNDDGVKGVKGSTRLEAKRQRRRDGRETTRRRAPILSEAEFLARREAVDRVMAVRQNGDRTQIAVLEDDILVEHYVTRASATSYVGNVYLGRVQNVLPSMEAAFIDIGKGRNGVLYAGEVNWDAAGLEGKSRAIEQALKSGDPVLVQVTKDPIGHKGARLTSQVSLPGRFLVYVPGGGMTGISRRLPDTERHRLKSILKKIVPEDAGVIVRTAAEGASEEDLTHDVERLKAQWESIEAKSKQTKSAPTLLHGEPDLATRVVRDVFNEDFKSLVVQGEEAWQTVSEYLGGVAPDLAERISRHTKDTDLFHDLRVDEQLMKALDRKVWLPSGGSLVIDRTEAMTVIDVNTGKFVGAGGNLEQTVTRNNLEAAEEIVRQLRLRDVGGIVVIDFIDMVLESNRELVLRRLTECLGRDRTKHQVAEVTSLGLVQMTRKRVGEGLLEAFSETCEVCHGRGVILHTEPVDKANGSAGEDDRPQGKQGKRKRGGRSAASDPVVESLDAVPVEKRKAASAAIAAIHRAANGESDGDDEDGLVDLASGLVSAAGEGDVVVTPEPGETAVQAPLAEPDHEAPEAAREAVDQAIESVAVTEGGPAPEPDTTSVNGAGRDTAAAPRRRRRSASRPAGPPVGV